jgi:hypothetical protein
MHHSWRAGSKMSAMWTRLWVTQRVSFCHFCFRRFLLLYSFSWYIGWCRQFIMKALKGTGYLPGILAWPLLSCELWVLECKAKLQCQVLIAVEAGTLLKRFIILICPLHDFWSGGLPPTPSRPWLFSAASLWPALLTHSKRTIPLWYQRAIPVLIEGEYERFPLFHKFSKPESPRSVYFRASASRL